jgi:cation transport ATPase
MTNREAALLWALAYGAALTGFSARIVYLLGVVSVDPPEGVQALRRWQRRRRWLVASEFAALPMFATLSVLAAYQSWLSPVAAAIVALFSGALGFPFFIHALQTLVNRRLDLKGGPS